MGRAYRRKDRRILRDHLDAQWRRGYSGPYIRQHKKLKRINESIVRRKQAMKTFEKLEQPDPPTLADVWPDA